MKKLAAALVSLFLAAAPAAHASLPDAVALTPLGAAERPLFAGGGTPVSNGIFFPGPSLCAGTYCAGEPYAIPKGSDIRFYNLDAAVVANAHRIVSKGRHKRTGAPLFASPTVRGPGDALMITSHLKPGIYPYTCTIHFAMDGILEVTE
ncbi:MAG: hypothetical protein M3273_02070 [Actinomycetota bacterium]|nr:hypothetical protein [Actinomycetota bacterium]